MDIAEELSGACLTFTSCAILKFSIILIIMHAMGFEHINELIIGKGKCFHLNMSHGF